MKKTAISSLNKDEAKIDKFVFLSKEEYNLILKFRSLDATDKMFCKDIIGGMVPRVKVPIN